MSKTGIRGFTKALAQEVTRTDMTVNTVSQGYLAAAMATAAPRERLAHIVTGNPGDAR